MYTRIYPNHVLFTKAMRTTARSSDLACGVLCRRTELVEAANLKFSSATITFCDEALSKLQFSLYIIIRKWSFRGSYENRDASLNRPVWTKLNDFAAYNAPSTPFALCQINLIQPEMLSMLSCYLMYFGMKSLYWLKYYKSMDFAFIDLSVFCFHSVFFLRFWNQSSETPTHLQTIFIWTLLEKSTRSFLSLNPDAIRPIDIQNIRFHFGNQSLRNIEQML